MKLKKEWGNRNKVELTSLFVKFFAALRSFAIITYPVCVVPYTNAKMRRCVIYRYPLSSDRAIPERIAKFNTIKYRRLIN